MTRSRWLTSLAVAAVAAVVAAWFTALPAGALPYEIAHSDHRYGSGKEQRARVFRPVGLLGRLPTAYFIHGGGWTSLDGIRPKRDEDRPILDEARAWARNGWNAVVVDYRLDVRGDLMFDDVDRAVGYYMRRAYVDPARQVVYGDSAGGHLATWYGAVRHDRFKAVIAFSPVASPLHAWQSGQRPGASETVRDLGEIAHRLFGYSWAGTAAYAAIATMPPTWMAGSDGEWVDWNAQGGDLCRRMGPNCQAHVVHGAMHASHLRNVPALVESSRAFAEHAVRAVPV